MGMWAKCNYCGREYWNASTKPSTCPGGMHQDCPGLELTDPEIATGRKATSPTKEMISRDMPNVDVPYMSCFDYHYRKEQ